MHLVHNMITPATILNDTLPDKLPWPELDWLHDIPGKTFYGLWITGQRNIPNNFDNYVFAWFGEPLDYPWLYQIAKANKTKKFIVLDNGPKDNTYYPKNVFYYSFPCYDLMINQILKWQRERDSNP